MQFLAELKEVKTTKTASLDKEVRVVLLTNDLEAVDLGKDDPDTMYVVTIEKDES